MNGFNIKRNNELVYLTIPAFEETQAVKHCFTTRLGGVSTGGCSSMNTDFEKEDNVENVRKNLSIICNEIKVDYKKLVFSDQTHDDFIRVITEEDIGKGISKQNDIVKTDGLITNIPGIPLITFYADCVPLFFLDPVKRVAGVTHSGWKGTVSRIAVKTIMKMNKEFGCEPKDCLVGIGPSIEQSCFEVGNEVLEQFQAEFPYWREFCISHENGKSNIDLWKANKLMLIECGVLEKNITISGMCTKCNEEMFFSYRRNGKERGSLSAIIELI